jgi:hypothetical protein
MKLLKRMLLQLGLEDERVQLVWASASEGTVLAAAVNRMTEQLRILGPLRWGDTVLNGAGEQRSNGAGEQGSRGAEEQRSRGARGANEVSTAPSSPDSPAMEEARL